MARTKILTILEQQISDTLAITNKTSQSYKVVLHHLHLLETEGTVVHKGKKPYVWLLTGSGQKRLVS